MSCVITVTDGSFYNEMMSCSQGKVFHFTDVIIGTILIHTKSILLMVLNHQSFLEQVNYSVPMSVPMCLK